MSDPIRDWRSQLASEYPTFRITVTGSRDWREIGVLRAALLDQLLDHGQFLLGVGDCPTGADKMALGWGKGRLTWPVVQFTAPWTQAGKGAGMIRNHFMIDMFRPHLVLAFPLLDSRGTVDCMDYAESRGIEVRRYKEGKNDHGKTAQ